MGRAGWQSPRPPRAGRYRDLTLRHSSSPPALAVSSEGERFGNKPFGSCGELLPRL